MTDSTGYDGTYSRLADTATPRWLRGGMRFLALTLGAAHTAVAVMQQSMNEDGIDYLDMGAAYVRGDWEMAVNGIWSPLYSWILGVVIHVIEPSPRWEFPTVQITNFFIYALALLCFEYFWGELTKRRVSAGEAIQGTMSFHPAVWLVLGYSLFIWSSLNLIEIWAVNPDMCVAALVYLAAGLFIKLSQSPGSDSVAVRLGLVLGLGYLAKAAMMPLAVMLILLTILIPAAGARRLRRLVIITVGFLAIAGPFMAALSSQYGKLTFSDVGRFTYLKHVNEMPYPNFHGALDRLAGEPVHPPRRIFDNPAVYEFAEPVGGTYPMSYDPGYWTEGLSPKVEVAQQARAIATQLMAYFDLFFRAQGGFTAIALLLLLASARAGQTAKASVIGPLLSVWAISAFGLYSLVNVTSRYIAPFVVVFWAGLLGPMRLPDALQCRRLAHASGALLILFVWINITALNLEGLAAMTGFSPLSESGSQASQFSDGHSADHPAIAEALLAQGLEPGDEVGFIGYSFSAYWARLARLRIVAEIHPEDMADFWAADTERQHHVLQAFAGTGIKATISEPIGSGSPPPGWEQIGGTGYLLHRFP